MLNSSNLIKDIANNRQYSRYVCHYTIFIYGLLVAIGTLLTVFRLLFGTARAVCPRYILLFLGFGLHFSVIYLWFWRTSENHSAFNYLVYFAHIVCF